MIDAYLAMSPAAIKVPVMLEEAELEYQVLPIAVDLGEQHDPRFRAISANDKVPAIVDHSPADGGPSLALFESAAILLYLSEKSKRFAITDIRGRAEMMQWLFWQASGLSPMSGQFMHFANFAPESARPYAMDRYANEVNRLFGVLNQRLSDRDFLCGPYSIADMATYTWTIYHDRLTQNIDDFPHVKSWITTIAERPAVIRAYQRVEREIPPPKIPPDNMDKFRSNLFGNTAKSLGLI